MSVPFAGELFTFEEPDGSQIPVEAGVGQPVRSGLRDARRVHRRERPGNRVPPLRPPVRRWHDAAAARTGVSVRRSRRVTRRSAAPADAARRLAGGTRPRRSRRAGFSGGRRWEQRRRERRAPPVEAAAEGPRHAAAADRPSATSRGLCILVQFPNVPRRHDHSAARLSTTSATRSGYSGFGNNGSVRDYFLEVSEGRASVPQRGHRLTTPRSTTATTTPTPAIPFGALVNALITEALDQPPQQRVRLLAAQSTRIVRLRVHAQRLLSQDHTSTPGARASGPTSSWLPDLGAAERTFRDYQITNMGAQLTLRTFCHENGHMVCDFPDLYDYGRRVPRRRALLPDVLRRRRHESGARQRLSQERGRGGRRS